MWEDKQGEPRQEARRSSGPEQAADIGLHWSTGRRPAWKRCGLGRKVTDRGGAGRERKLEITPS